MAEGVEPSQRRRIDRDGSLDDRWRVHVCDRKGVKVRKGRGGRGPKVGEVALEDTRIRENEGEHWPSLRYREPCRLRAGWMSERWRAGLLLMETDKLAERDVG